jgi:hypothetical protein
MRLTLSLNRTLVLTHTPYSIVLRTHSYSVLTHTAIRALRSQNSDERDRLKQEQGRMDLLQVNRCVFRE